MGTKKFQKALLHCIDNAGGGTLAEEGCACLETSHKLKRPRHWGFCIAVTTKGQEDGAHTHSPRLGWGSLVKGLPGMCEALGSISTTTKHKQI